MKIFSHTFLGEMACLFTQGLVKTYRSQVILHPTVNLNQHYVYAFWHGKQLAPILLLNRFGTGKHVGFVSASRDGEILAAWLKRLGYQVVRGSSSRKSTSGLVKLLAALRKGYSVGIAADGPRGPRFQAKTGVSFLAHKAGLQIIPLGVAHSHKWQFKKAWDHYELPLPGAKVVVYFGEPFSITDLIDKKQINEAVAQAIHVAEEKAAKILIGDLKA